MMDNIIVIDCSHDTYRTAVVENGALVELLVDNKSDKSLVGDIYLGEIKNILPSQFAFVNIGHEKNAFLFLSDAKERVSSGRPKYRKNTPLLVQVTKDPTGGKGAYVTTQISLAGRYCVLSVSPGGNGFNAVSRKTADPREIDRLKSIAREKVDRRFGVIFRTNAQGVPSADIEAEINRHLEKFGELFSRAEYTRPPSLLYSERSPLFKNMIDLFNDRTKKILINDRAAYEQLKSFVSGFFAGAAERIEYTPEKPVFDVYGIEEQIARALSRKVWLKCGGFLIFDRTEAMTVVDVNSGKFLGSGGHQNSMMTVNLEAAAEIARQLRLRNLSGIILVDFIDVKDDENKQALMDVLTRETAKDRISVNVVGLTNLGLAEITRKKGREPLDNIMRCPCEACGGSGRDWNAGYIARKILSEAEIGIEKTHCRQVRVLTSRAAACAARGIIARGGFAYPEKIVLETEEGLPEGYSLTRVY